MKKNRKKDMTPYNMASLPKRQNPLLLPLIWAACFIMTRKGKLKIKRIGMKGLKPPYLVLSEHQGFTDYYITPLALFPHRATYVSDVEGFAAFGKWLYSAIGCIPTRRFVPDISLIKSIRHVVKKNKDIIVVYPEARHSNVGTNSYLPPSVGKLVRFLNIPVVILKEHGSYLDSPIWDESHRRGAPLSATLELVLSSEEIKTHSADEITKLLNEKFQYDEYRWQFENRICISYPNRAEGLHKILYLCPKCNSEYTIISDGNWLVCTNCKKQWKMNEYGRLHAESGNTEFSHIPDWYAFEREHIARQIENRQYKLDIEVNIEALPNEKGFVSLGKGRLSHCDEGFRLNIPETGKELFFSSEVLTSVHNEYDYKGRGDGLVLSKNDCCYYLYPLDSEVNVTKIQLAAEHFHFLSRG